MGNDFGMEIQISHLNNYNQENVNTAKEMKNALKKVLIERKRDEKYIEDRINNLLIFNTPETSAQSAEGRKKEDMFNGVRTNLLATLYVLMGGGGGVVPLIFNSLYNALVRI